MTFGDRFILWVHLGLVAALPVGRDTLARLFALAHQRERLVPARLNDLSILLLLADCPASSPLRSAAQQQADVRGFARQPEYLWQLLRLAAHPPLTELLELGRPRVPTLRAITQTILAHPDLVGVRNDLCQFLGRLFLVEPASCQRVALERLVQATTLYYRLPPGTIDYKVRLYQHVLRHLRPADRALPSVFPAGPRPGWFTALEPDEQLVLTRCLERLAEPDLVRFALHFHARLTAEQSAAVLGAADPTWTADRVVAALERCWEAVL